MNNAICLCRVCLGKGEINIFRKTTTDDLTDDPISDRLMACSAIHVEENDGFPSNICSQCLTELDSAYKFRKKCETSEKLYIEYFGLSSVNKLFKSEDDSMESTTAQSVGECELLPCMESIKAEYEDSHTVAPPAKNIKSDKHSKTGCVESKKRASKILKTKQRTHNKSCAKKTNDNFMEAKIKDKICSAVKPKERDKTRKHMCTVCGKTFLFHGNLLDHERIHSGDKPFGCDICNRRFAQAGHLMIHTRTHSGVKPYQCELCPRAFTVSHALKKHVRIHTGERPYACTMCGKSFITSYHLSNHFKRHTGDKKFKCDWPQCELGFINISEMKRHRIRHEQLQASIINKNIASLTGKSEASLTSKRKVQIPIIDLKIIPSNAADISSYNEFRRSYKPIF